MNPLTTDLADHFGRPRRVIPIRRNRASRICRNHAPKIHPNHASKIRPIDGSLWPSRDGSDRAVLDTNGPAPRLAGLGRLPWTTLRVTRFFACTVCLGRAMDGERAWCLAPRSRMQDARRRRARRWRRAGRSCLARNRRHSSSKEPLSCRAVSFCHRRRRAVLATRRSCRARSSRPPRRYSRRARPRRWRRTSSPSRTEPHPRRRALRPPFSHGLGHPLAPNLRRRREVMRRMRRTHDRARRRHRPSLHRQAATRAPATTRSARRSLTAHANRARHVAPTLRCVQRPPTRTPLSSLPGFRRPRPPPPGLCSPPCEPSAAILDDSLHDGLYERPAWSFPARHDF